jgi:predicted enzyme related to lactoylglutathione lyase
MTVLKQLTHVNVWVRDQDEALAFYTEKLGMELRDDVTMPEMGNFRWLTVGHPDQPDVALALMKIMGPPVFATDDCRTTYEQLKKLGVEFSQEPTEQPYGIDAGFRDPSGNQIRMAQLK